MLVAVFGILIGGVIAVLASQDMRTEITSWVSSQFSTPTPVPVVILAADTPTPTAIPTPPAPTNVPLIPTSTPTSEPTLAPTAEPTATATPNPTPPPSEYTIDDVDVKLVTSAGGMTIADLSVSVRNVSAGTGRAPIELLMSVDGGEPELVTIISGLTAGEAELFVFSREFSPGRYTLTLIAEDALSEVSIDVAPATVALVVPTSTPTVTPTPSPTETPEPTATATPKREPTSTPQPAPTIVIRQARPAPTAPAIASSGAVAPHLRHLEYKQYMLELINEERAHAGLSKVILGDNTAAQLHAEAAIQHCFGSHWGIDGLKPYMRYSLAGGYQSNAENGSGSDYCIAQSDGYRALGSIEHEVHQAMDGWMDSSGHRRNILRPWHKKINVGLAWDRYNFAAYQHFEGDYIEYDQLPTIEDGFLSMSGSVKNGATIKEERNLGVQIYYDPPPHPLTRGQVSRTYCYDNGLQIASLRPPLSGNWFYDEDNFTKEYKPCPDPYDIPSDAPAPKSAAESHKFWREAYDTSQSRKETTMRVPWITATEWHVKDQSFSVLADLREVVTRHGTGVYTVFVWGTIAEEHAAVSQYSIFHGVTPPDTYSVGVSGG